MITVPLTDEQAELLQPYFDKVKAEHQKGFPCAIMAQVFQDLETGEPWIEARFIDHATVSKIQGITGAS